MGKKGSPIKSMADAGISNMTKTGSGYVEPKVKREGEYVGVDIDCARVLQGHAHGAKAGPIKSAAKQSLMGGKQPKFLDSTTKKMG